MKKITYVVISAVVVLIAYRLINKGGRLSRAVENTVDNVGVSVEEMSLSSRPLVIQKEMLAQRERDNREWTTDNINKHPDLYLSHCGRVLAQFNDQYEAALLEVDTNLNLIRRELSDAQEGSKPMLRFLKEAKEALANPNLVYPTKVGVFTYENVGNLKASVLTTDAKLSESEASVKIRNVQLEQLQLTRSELVKGHDRVRMEIKGLDGRVAQAKSKNLMRAVDGLNARMNALMSSIDAISGHEDARPGLAVEPKAVQDVEEVFARRGIK